MNICLLKAIRAVDLVDSHPDRQEFFEQYIERYLIARILIFFHSLFKGTFLSALMYLIFAARYLIKSSYAISHKYKLLATVDYINEQRAISDFLSYVDDSLIKQSARQKLNQACAIFIEVFCNLKNLFRVAKFLTKFEKKGTFLTTCRVAELFFLYLIAKKRINHSKAIIIASNYTPCACALKAAAEFNKLPTIYTFHAVVTSVVRIPALKVNLACLYGERALDVFRLNGEIKCDSIVYTGLQGDSVKMQYKKDFDDVKSVGVFLSGYIKPESFRLLLENLSKYSNIEQIYVRPHPLKEANPDLSILSEFSKIIIDTNARVTTTAKVCDLVIAGSSGVHVEVLKAGVPVLYWEDFDTVGPDYYSFIQYGIVLEIKDINTINWQEVKNFYNQDWSDRFQKFDYSYLRTKTEIHNNIKENLEQLLAKY